jgi:hypothetical protein
MHYCVAQVKEPGRKVFKARSIHPERHNSGEEIDKLRIAASCWVESVKSANNKAKCGGNGESNPSLHQERAWNQQGGQGKLLKLSDNIKNSVRLDGCKTSKGDKMRRNQ